MPNLTELNANPWRFNVGDTVYIAGRPQLDATVVNTQHRQIETEHYGRIKWPYYLVVDYYGDNLWFPQHCLSSTPILP